MEETMFERFTDHARSAVVTAQELGVRYGQVGEEQLLLGIARTEGSAGASALNSLGVDARRVEDIVGPPPAGEPRTRVPFAPDAKRVFEVALTEAVARGHDRFGSATCSWAS
jgi:hypothetical protein